MRRRQFQPTHRISYRVAGDGRWLRAAVMLVDGIATTRGEFEVGTAGAWVLDSNEVWLLCGEAPMEYRARRVG